MIRRPPRSTLDRSSAASDVYKRQGLLSVMVYQSVSPSEADVGLTIFSIITGAGQTISVFAVLVARICPLNMTIPAFCTRPGHWKVLLTVTWKVMVTLPLGGMLPIQLTDVPPKETVPLLAVALPET